MMGDDSKKIKTASHSWMFWAFVWGAIGYFVYGTPMGTIGLALFSAVTGLTVSMGLIPIVGVWLTYVATNYIKNWLLQYIMMSWAISTIFLITLIGSTLLTLMVLILIILKVIE